MNESEQVTHFADDIDKIVDRYRDEYDISIASAVGVLQMKIHLLCREAEELGNE